MLEDQLWQIDAAWGAVPPLIERLNTLITTRIPVFNAGLDAVAGKVWSAKFVGKK